MLTRTKDSWEDRRFCGTQISVYQWLHIIHPHFSDTLLDPICTELAQKPVLNYDEHSTTSKYKFGIIYQKFGQVSENEILGNSDTSIAFQEFLDQLGYTVELRGFEGYSGGLDTKNDLTGTESLYTVYRENEIMFHVSTLLPNSENGDQQLAKKRHIGNDICCIVFQEENTPFLPASIPSQFLHCFIVVQPIKPNTPVTRYKVSIACKSDVMDCPPVLPTEQATFMKGNEFREFLLAKLVNAEHAAYYLDSYNIFSNRMLQKCTFLDISKSL